MAISLVTDIPIIGSKPDAPLPKPLSHWVLVRKEKRSLLSGLELPDSADGSFKFFVQDFGPDVKGLEVGDGLELQPRQALTTVVMIDDNYALIRADGIAGVYREAK